MKARVSKETQTWRRNSGENETDEPMRNPEEAGIKITA